MEQWMFWLSDGAISYIGRKHAQCVVSLCGAGEKLLCCIFDNRSASWQSMAWCGGIVQYVAGYLHRLLTWQREPCAIQMCRSVDTAIAAPSTRRFSATSPIDGDDFTADEGISESARRA